MASAYAAFCGPARSSQRSVVTSVSGTSTTSSSFKILGTIPGMAHREASGSRPVINDVAAFSAWPVFGDEEVSAAVRVLKSGKVNYWTGTEGHSFEDEFAGYVGTRHAVALANGTVALEAALLGIGFQAGDEAIVTPRSFVASASSVALAGGTPIFADVDRKSGNLDPIAVEQAISPRTRAIIAVYLAGRPCEMDSLSRIARDRNIPLIEDCAQAHGAKHRGRRLGSIGTVGTWSFCQDKIITTAGEGGMITTSDADVWRRVWEHKDHGKSYDRVFNQIHPSGYRWIHEGIGTNWRMTEVQSAIGRVMLRKLDDLVARRRANAKILDDRLAESAALRVEPPAPHEESSYYKYYFYVRQEYLKSGWSRNRIMDEVTALGIPCYSGSCSELYREASFLRRGLGPPAPLPVAKELGESSLMLLVDPTLDDWAMNRAADAVNSVMRDATR